MEKRLLKACSDAALSALKESSKTVKPKAFRKSAAPSAYILFTKAKRPELKGSSPDLKPTEVMRALAQLWKQTTESERAPFIEEASQLKAAAAGLEPEQRSMSEESASFTIKGQDTSKVTQNISNAVVKALLTEFAKAGSQGQEGAQVSHKIKSIGSLVLVARPAQPKGALCTIAVMPSPSFKNQVTVE
uniref:HMG box domain-containing protein n=1 Tax=Haptolina ericina TaxID=156174 RepID=A0A7S3BCN0_9EUKA|mmetsp:Transcript_56790/g.126825  ORF Transcript_56790/g.126825 Transcript_56790/m.126825 type:complete len:189 (+) Transcript_56790:40-606(+)|eukprot:CAMPEP_0181193956 /NCGR_PEP_ID=MMETSP1096-20121128/14087_1 /TAXON_ID=156174 ORGANISM="Chrysochromulina ericina, Strain CCMP281" /NCGR_SAMPLE_ID=MMETSP1096 /ASSEMBLY_ACC=CAM_ASM_000453 /LENGTH=188 /DNA_ID=CAMNT_0023283441 /DNA_START=41 /DNA_END=607 /DNA_ORIENTATION=-